MTESLSFLKPTELIGELKTLVQKEKLLTLKIIDYLAEVNRRKAYLPKYTSLFSFMVEELHYCAGTAQLRLNTLRALQVVPEVREKVLTNKVSLNTLAKTQSFINNENRLLKNQAAAPLTLLEQRELFSAIELTPPAQIETVLLNKKHEIEVRKAEAQGLPAPSPKPKLQKLELEADAELVAVISELKSLLSHQCPHGDLSTILKKALPLALHEIKIAKGLIKRTEAKAETIKEKQNEKEEKTEGNIRSSLMKLDLTERKQTSKQLPRVITRAIPLKVKREVWKRDQGRCQHQDPTTKQRCLSKHQVEFDHVRPWSMGGEHSIENLYLCCKVHNNHRWERLQMQTTMNR